MSWYAGCELIYGYYPLGGEVDCLPFLRQALCDKKAVALPRVGKSEGEMDFYLITSLAQVSEGAFHVSEPVPGCPLVQSRDAVVLVPGVVFSRDGARYGYGKGYYDRYLARFPGLIKVAPAFENQLETGLPQKPTDVRMDFICTEKAVYVVRERA